VDALRWVVGLLVAVSLLVILIRKKR